MSTLKKFIKNTTILIFAKALQPLITFVLIITISQKAGLEAFGAYGTIFKYIPIFQIIAGFGLRNLLAREIAQNRDSAHKLVVAATVIALACAIVSAALMGLFVNILSNNPLVIYGTILASISMIAAGLADVYEGVISGFEELKQVGYALVAENAFRVGISLLLIYNGYGIIAIVVVFVIGRFLKTLYLYFYIDKKLVKATGKLDREFMYKLFKQAKTFALITVCVTIYWNIDGIMLESMRSATEVGYYSVAFMFMTLSMILVHSYVSSLFPVISNYYEVSKPKFEIACRKSLRILLVAVIPIAIVLSLLADKIILLLFKEAFLPSVKVLQILIWSLIPYAVSQIFAYALVAGKQQNIDLKINSIAMFSNITLNFLLIPRFGFMGATIATVFSINIYVALQIRYVFQELISFSYKAIFNYGYKMILVGLLMAGSIIISRDLNLFVIIPIGLIVYFAGILSFGIINKNDRQMVISLVKGTL